MSTLQTTLASVIRARIDEGRLPADAPEKVWGSYGSFLPCDGCGDKILLSQIEYSFTIGHRTVRLHAHCYGHWRPEQQRRAAGRLTRAILEGGGTTCVDCTARTLGVSTEGLTSRLLKLRQIVAVGSCVARCCRCDQLGLVLKI